MRIVSLLPAATEILFALGAGDAVAGVSHECDYPPGVLDKPRVLESLIESTALGSAAIDAAVRQAVTSGKQLYRVDVPLLRALAPDLIVTQQLCPVCAVDTTALDDVLPQLHPRPRVEALHAHTLQGLFDDVRRIAEATGRIEAGERLCAELMQRLERVAARVRDKKTKPRVACLEWLDPLMTAGHWVPEQVALAGGIDVLAKPGERSVRVEPEPLIRAQPDVLILMPCGFNSARTRAELPRLTAQRWWNELPAVQRGNVHVVDGPAFFNRPGPRLIDGVELLADLL